MREIIRSIVRWASGNRVQVTEGPRSSRKIADFEFVEIMIEPLRFGYTEENYGKSWHTDSDAHVILDGHIIHIYRKNRR